jgi:hypothetical protein
MITTKIINQQHIIDRYEDALQFFSPFFDVEDHNWEEELMNEFLRVYGKPMSDIE